LNPPPDAARTIDSAARRATGATIASLTMSGVPAQASSVTVARGWAE
jgi:hypothetical protein